ncbi:MAG: hypothetical protein Q8878_08380, partial [Bacillota bacterium]|nr:hypothetical protein [Bacillota bacterium]
MNYHASDYLDLSDNRLKQFASRLARENPKGGPSSAGKDIRRLRKALFLIGKTYKRAVGYIESETLIPQELEWLTDNYYIAQSMGDEAMQAIRSYKLPSLKQKRGVVYVSFLAEDFLQATGYVVSEEKIAVYLEGIGEESELSEEELSAFLSFVKAGIIHLIADVCEEINSVLTGFSGKDKNSLFYDEMRLYRMRESGPEPSTLLINRKRETHKTHEQLSDLLRRAFSSLRFIIDYDFNTLIKEQNPVERILSEDPSGDYRNMSEKSRAYYRYRLSKLARKAKISGRKSAELVVGLAKEGKSRRERHVGYYILEKPLGKEKEKLRGRLYIASILALCLAIAALFAYFANNAPAFFLFLVPAFEVAKRISDFFVIRIVPPAHLPRLELEGGIPEEGKTLCVITALITDEASCKKLAGLLNEYIMSNTDAGKNAGYGLLLDLKDGKNEKEEQDEKIMDAARKAVAGISSQGKNIYLFVRRRTFNRSDGIYMGYERKRGASSELVSKIKGKNSGILVLKGDEENLKTYRFLVTLDADTRPEPES